MMDENCLQKCESRTFVKSVYLNSNRKKSKLWVQRRCCIFVGVILFFYANFLLFDVDWRQQVEKVPLKQYNQPTRKLLSLVSTSAIDLENSLENISVRETHYSSSRSASKHPLEEIRAAASLAATPTATTNTIHTVDASLRSNVTSHTLNCTPAAILEFPSDGLTRTQRQHGWIVLHILLALYCFWLLAVICDDYFLPAIELICQTLHMQADVVGATFMAVATSSPELFMNGIGTFVTKGDIGVSTIVGSSVFNLLAVPACCGLFVGQSARLNWWPVSRDCLMYCLAVLALIATLRDGRVMWYESLLLFVAYFFYMAVMYNNDRVARSARRLVSMYRRRLHLIGRYWEVNELTPLIGRKRTCGSITNSRLAASMRSINTCASSNHLTPFYIPACSSTQLYPSLEDLESCRASMTQNTDNCSSTVASDHCSDTSTDFADTPWQRKDASWPHFLLRWPITFLLYATVPDSRKHARAKYFTFVASIVWIAVISYVVAYAITVIGDTLSIPDSVMGLTILSAGMSVPEAVSSIIVTKQGHGAMGISNAIGSNTFDILLCLSVPWFIKAYFLPNQPDEMWVSPNSNGLTYSVTFLLASVICLFVTLLGNRFRLDRTVGWICAILYLCFIIWAALIELNVFFPINLPVCEH